MTTNTVVTSSPDLSSSSPSKGTIAGVVGGVVGGVLFFGLCSFSFAWYKIRARRRKLDIENSRNQSTELQRYTLGETPSATERAVMEQSGVTDEDSPEQHEITNRGGMEQVGVPDEDSLEQPEGANQGDMEQLGVEEDDSLEQPEVTPRGGMEQTGDDPGLIALRYPGDI